MHVNSIYLEHLNNVDASVLGWVADVFGNIFIKVDLTEGYIMSLTSLDLRRLALRITNLLDCAYSALLVDISLFLIVEWSDFYTDKLRIHIDSLLLLNIISSISAGQVE